MYFFNKEKPKTTYDPIQKNRQEIYKVINDKKIASTKEGRTILKIYRAVMCSFIGEACTDNPEDGDKNFNKSILGRTSNLITLTYSNPPASGVYWAYSSLENAGFIPKTYAAEGLGFNALKPFMNIWKVFRDICYMLLVIVLIAIGFMVMFRTKINPQTIISVENALPRIVISLILITFSFPIAGLLIDLMYVFIVIAIAILGNKGNFFNITEFQNKYLGANFFTIGTGLFPLGFFTTIGRLANSIVALLPIIINQFLRLALGITGSILLMQLSHPIFSTLSSINETVSGNIATEPVGGIFEIFIEGIISVLLGIVGFGLGYTSLTIVVGILVFFTFIFTLFRIFFLLFSSYIKIFLMAIFSPFFALFEAIPGKNSFSYWLKSLSAEIFVFPIVIICFALSYLIINILPLNGNIWQPPFLTQLDPEAFTTLLAIGILFLIPDIVKLVKQMFGIKDTPINLGVGTYFGGAGAAIGGTQGAMSGLSSLSQMPFIGLKIRQAALNRPDDKPGFWGTLFPVSIAEKYYNQQLQNANKEAKKNG